MKKLHVLNIGYPKTSTTWLWHMLTENNIMALHPYKENHKLIFGQSIDEYKKEYSYADITGNSCTAMLAIDRYVIKQLFEIDTVRASLIIRNPFEMLWSYYNWAGITIEDFETHCYNLYDQGWLLQPSKIVTRWKTIFGEERFKLFFYDDCLHDSENFFKNYCNQMTIPLGEYQILRATNRTNYSTTMPKLSKDLVKLINHEIELLELTVDKNLSAWKL